MPEMLGKALERSGFRPRRSSQEQSMAWELSPPGTARHVYVRIQTDAERRWYLIDVEEWRGGEGYEDTPLRSSDPTALLAAIPRWVEWANEPFTPSWWQRLRGRLGLP